MLSSCVCLCICLVTLQYCIKSAKHSITQIMPHDSSGTLVFWHQSSQRNSKGNTPYGGDKYRWGKLKLATFVAKFYWLLGSSGRRRISMPNFVKIGQSVAKILRFFDFSRWRPSPSWMFEIVNFYMLAVFGGLSRITVPNIVEIGRLSYHICVNIETSYLVYKLIVASPSRRMTNRAWKGRGYVTWHVFNFGCRIHISGKAEARALKLCTKGDYIKSGQSDDKSPLKGAWFCSRD